MADNMNLKLKIPFANNETANIARNSLIVDPEPKRNHVSKKIVVENNILYAYFEASEARTLRVASNSFLDHLILVMKTIEQFTLT